MLKYASFPVAESEAINSFFEANSDGIAKDGICFLEGRMCIIYSDADETEMEKQNCLKGGREFIAQRSAELLGADVDERHFRRLALMGNESARNKVVETANRKMMLAAQIDFAHDIMKTVEDGTWFENIKGAKSE